MDLEQIKKLTPEQVSLLSSSQIQDINRLGWNELAVTNSEGANTSYPQYGPWMKTDEELNLLGDVEGKSIVEIGCAKGNGLAYLSDKGAGELIGVDISSKQIELAKQNEKLKKAKLVVSPMERDLQRKQFADFVLSLYSIGYSSNMPETLKLFNSYLKKGGKLVLSWIHPMYNCLTIENGKIVMNDSYFREGPVLTTKGPNDIPLIQQKFKQSTFIKNLYQSGFAVTDIIEDDPTPEPGMHVGRFYAREKAEKCPNTLLIVAEKMQ